MPLPPWLDGPVALRLLRACTVATAVTAPVAWLDGSLFAWHPSLMVVGAAGCATEAALAARAARAMEAGPGRVTALWRHVRWAVLASTCLAAGLAAIVANKARHGKPHLRTTHARVGAAAGLAGFAAGVLGPLAFRTLGWNARLPVEWQDRVKAWHRMAGALTWGLCALAIELGLGHKAVYKGWLTTVWQAAVAAAALLLAILFYGPLRAPPRPPGLPSSATELSLSNGSSM